MSVEVHALDITTHEGLGVITAMLAAQVADVQITDPPFSAHVHANMVSNGSAGRGPRARDVGFASLTPELRSVIAAVAASIPRWTVLHSDYEGALAWREAMTEVEWIRLVPWVRWGQPQNSGDRPGSQSEAVLHFHPPGRKRWNGNGGMMCYDARALRGKDKHPTEKPLDLALTLVSCFSDPGETIFDGNAGHGTTGLAARLLGRSAILFERDAEFAKAARRRVDSPRLSKRDIDRAKEWAEVTHAEAQSYLAKPAAPDGSDRNVRRRATQRLVDAKCLMRNVGWE